MARTLLLTAGGLAAILLVLYGLVLAWLWFQQEKLLFFPQPLPQDQQLAVEPGVHELQVQVPGAQLSVLHMQLPAPKGVVFFLHGNAGNLAGWFTNTSLYRRANYDLVMMDYRGYGKSTGRIESEQQLRDDAMAVWKAVAPRYAGRKVVIHGRSLGTALAADLAATLGKTGPGPDLTVLVTPYSSVRALATEVYPWVPAALLRYPLDTLQSAQGVRGPILLVHAERDELIGLHHAQRLAQALPAARLEVIRGAGHNDVHAFERYEALMRNALAGL
jgi:pimeloyl-ACP methyl ester carboxylesterase